MLFAACRSVVQRMSLTCFCIEATPVVPMLTFGTKVDIQTWSRARMKFHVQGLLEVENWDHLVQSKKG